jgi:hypothetical protein
MKKTLLTVAAAAVSVTCLAWAQPPQGAKETVVIKEEAAAAKKPKETLPAPGAAPKPKVARDPFVKGGEAPPPPPPMKPEEKGKEDPNKPPEIKGPGEKVVPIVAAPDVTVKGILLGPRGNRAIVTGPTMTFIVKQGDKLGDYKVANIDRKSVVFSFKNKKFPIKLEDEFAAAKK